ncbi:MAG: fatty acid desaturase [Firmicutes bacterium]|nr:fatty acid desaturase [Bacillota bacterium]
MQAHRHRQEWKSDRFPYDQPSRKKSAVQLLNSIGPYAVLWSLSAWISPHSAWLAVLIAIMASGFFIRIFIIFHDCGHYSFCPRRQTNEWVGMVTGLLTFFPYHKWKYEHARHHATSGKLSHRGTGDIWILTVNEYQALPRSRQLIYRLYRNPLILFGLGPIFIVIKARLNRKGAPRRERWNTYLTNIFLIVLLGVLGKLLGWLTILIIQGTILYVAGIIGVWLFYVQHQFEHGYFEGDEQWSYVSAALKGSSYYKLPVVLQWFTGNIGFHHVHHLEPRIPNYRLQQAHEQSALLQTVPHISLSQSLCALRYRLWDEQNMRFVPFRQTASFKSRKSRSNI